MKISLVVPVHNAYKYVKKALISVLRNFDFDNGEVLIVDDFSDNKTARLLDKFAAKYPEKFRIIRNTVNLGFLKSCNMAASNVSGDIIVFLNSDCEIPKDFSSRVAACFRHDENIIAASPIASQSASFTLNNILPLEITNALLKKRRIPQYPDIPHAEGFCLCVRKSYVDKYGLFDTVYGFGYCEEVDFCFGVRARGLRCVLIDNLYVKHARNKSFGKTKTEALAKNNKILFDKWGDMVHQKEITRFENPMISVIRDTFGIFRTGVFFLFKLRRQKVSNRIKTLKNLFKIKKYQNGMSKKVVYTAIAGNSDLIPIVPDYVSKDWDYVCFTDNKTLLKLGQFGPWKIKPLQFSLLDDTKNARWHKTHPAELFPEYTESLWLDANINILTPYIFDFLKDTEKELLVPKHYCRRCVYQEIEVVNARGKEKTNVIENIENFLQQQGMPRNFGLNETNIIYRKHTANVKKLMDDWWFMIENYSKRDQLSFSYVLWKNSIDIRSITMPNARIDFKDFKMFTHNPKDTITGKVLSFLFPSK